MIVQEQARQSQDPPLVSLHTLKRRLAERGLLQSTDKKRSVFTVRRQFNGVPRHDVLHLSVAIFNGALDEPPLAGSSDNGPDDVQSSPTTLTTDPASPPAVAVGSVGLAAEGERGGTTESGRNVPGAEGSSLFDEGLL
jgi:hypothetical protein